MTMLLAFAGALVMLSAAGAVAGLARGQARARLARLPYAILRLAALLVPPGQREDLHAEWRSEAYTILAESGDVPAAGLLRATWFALGLLARGRAMARELDGTAGARRRQLLGLLARMRRGARELAARAGGRGARRQGITVSGPAGSIAVPGRAVLAASVALMAAAAITASVPARSGAPQAAPPGSGAPAGAKRAAQVPPGFAPVPVGAGETAVVSTGGGYLRALDVAARNPHWAYHPPPGGTVQELFAADGAIYVIDGISGGGGPCPFAGFGTLAAAGGTVYVTSTAGTVLALDAATGKPRRSYPAATARTVAGGTVHAGDAGHHTLRALDAATGRPRWSYPLAGDPGPAGWGSLTAAGDTAYVTSIGGTVLALDAATGKPRRTYITGSGRAPLSSRSAGCRDGLATLAGTVYVFSDSGDAGGNLYVFPAVP
jgi:hypothetical protein